MNTIILAIVAAIGLSTGDINVKSINTEASTIEWVGKKVTGKHTGTIKIKEGSFEFDGDKVVSGSFVIDMTSIENTDLSGNMQGKLVGHLKSADFFDVANHPTATFKLHSMNDEGSVYGHLTIKGITKPISFDASFEGNKASAKIVVDRSKYDVRYGSGSFFDNLGDKAIYDEFTLNVNLVM